MNLGSYTGFYIRFVTCHVHCQKSTLLKHSLNSFASTYVNEETKKITLKGHIKVFNPLPLFFNRNINNAIFFSKQQKQQYLAQISELKCHETLDFNKTIKY